MIPISELRKLEVIGTGGFAIVYKGIYRKTSVAIKQMTNKDDADFDPMEFIEEARIMMYVKKSQKIVVSFNFSNFS